MARATSCFFARLPGEYALKHITKANIRKLTMLTGDPSGLEGEYDFMTYGDCTNIYGKFRGLKGDVSKLRGDVSNIRGYCTGVDIDCTGLSGDIQKIYKIKLEEERFKKNGVFLNKHRFLTNAENEKLWDVWLKIANSTIGMTDEEYKLIQKPVKNKPPFDVDVWGRHYEVDENGDVICFSINPADILLLRTNQEQQTCWSIYDKKNGRLRMRLLLARASINPTVGVCFRIKSIDKFNIFNGLSFKYYKHQDGTYFQYNNNGLQPFGNVNIDVTKWFERENGCIEPFVVGHDSVCSLGHDGQNEMTFYERFIKKDFALWRDKMYELPEGTVHVLSNFNGVICLDIDFNILFKSECFSKEFADKQIKCLQDRLATGVFNEEV